MKLINILFESGETDYRGEHSAPGSDDAPIWDVTKGVYPEDFYSLDGARYYGENAGNPSDQAVVALIKSVRNKPAARVKIYRAVPKELGLQEQIDELIAEKKYILKYGKLPHGVITPLDRSKYYNHISDIIDSLQSRIDAGEKDKTGIEKINSGDWVTIYRPYAKEHGMSSLRGKYKILSMTVPAKNLFTDGNSIYEWGYIENV